MFHVFSVESWNKQKSANAHLGVMLAGYEAWLAYILDKMEKE